MSINESSKLAAPEGPVQRELLETLRLAFPDATHLQITNESAAHAVPKGSETHFRIVIACPQFGPLTRLARHRLVQQAIAVPASRIKAITVRPVTPEELARGEGQDASPTCRGG